MDKTTESQSWVPPPPPPRFESASSGGSALGQGTLFSLLNPLERTLNHWSPGCLFISSLLPTWPVKFNTTIKLSTWQNISEICNHNCKMHFVIMFEVTDYSQNSFFFVSIMPDTDSICLTIAVAMLFGLSIKQRVKHANTESMVNIGDSEYEVKLGSTICNHFWTVNHQVIHTSKCVNPKNYY